MNIHIYVYICSRCVRALDQIVVCAAGCSIYIYITSFPPYTEHGSSFPFPISLSHPRNSFFASLHGMRSTMLFIMNNSLEPDVVLRIYRSSWFMQIYCTKTNITGHRSMDIITPYTKYFVWHSMKISNTASTSITYQNKPQEIWFTKKKDYIDLNKWAMENWTDNIFTHDFKTIYLIPMICCIEPQWLYLI